MNINKFLCSKKYSYFAAVILGCMVSPPTIKLIVISSFIAIAITYSVVSLQYNEKANKPKKGNIGGAIALLLEILIGFRFCNSWKVSSFVARMAAIVHLDKTVFLSIVAAALLMFSYAFLRRLIWCVAKKIKDDTELDRFTIVLIVLLICIQNIQLQYSAISTSVIANIIKVKWWMQIINGMALCVFLLFLRMCASSWNVAYLLMVITTFLWSFANYFTVKFHGSPLFFSEFENFMAAAAVVKGYSFEFDKGAWVISILSVIQIFFAGIFYIHTKTIETNLAVLNRTKGLICVAAMSAAIIILYGIPEIKPRTTMLSSWVFGVEDYGYVSCIFEDVEKRISPIEKPEGYSAGALEDGLESIPSNTTGTSDYPDIILILNETFYDLSVAVDLKLESDCLSEFYSIEGAHYGYAVVPNVGGGTNNTEYELLTSNSMRLLPIAAPFNYLDFENNKANAVQYFLQQGYVTTAMHCGTNYSYSRGKVYPQLGFQNVVLGGENFTFDTYGNRKWTDSSNYRDLLSQYEKNLVTKQPQFVYMLTFQNHGDWDQNDSSYDTIHTGSEFGDLTDDVNEYLTSVNLSARSFLSLIEYFEKSDRPAIVCMLGDHSPSLINDLPLRTTLSVHEKEVSKRMVPYVIWANYEVEFAEEMTVVSMTDIIPMIKSLARMELTRYDSIILELQKVAPIRTATGIVMDQNKEVIEYNGTDNGDYRKTILQTYLFAEYSILTGKGSNLTELE